VRAIQIYASSTLAQVSFLAPTPDTFRQFLDQQLFFVFFITVYIGGGLIANDRRANALQIYLSKPLTRGEYIFGKMAVLMAFLLFITWVPGVLLLAIQIVFAGNFTFFRNNVYLFPAITLYAVLISTVASAAILALSSLSKSARFVGILYAALIFFSQALYGVLRAVTGGSMISWVSIPQDLSQVGNVIFRLPLQYDTPWPVSLLMVAALVAGAAVVLERRVRGVEVVA
jgi:ABC-2 type transport system permease protein